MFRDLKSDEIDVRIGSFKEGKGASLLLYKNARVDMDILDETVNSFNWKREHTRDNKNCIVSIWDKEKSQWISKEDTGTESNSEREKGLASDSFKRACFNWGIGRELYTAPFIWVSNCSKYEKFAVKDIKIENKKIINVVIVDSKGKVAFKMNSKATSKSNKTSSDESFTMTRDDMLKSLKKALNSKEKLDATLKHYGATELEMMTILELKDCCEKLKIK